MNIDILGVNAIFYDKLVIKHVRFSTQDIKKAFWLRK